MKAYRSAYHDRSIKQQLCRFNGLITCANPSDGFRCSDWSPQATIRQSDSRRRKKLIEICDYWESCTCKSIEWIFGLKLAFNSRARSAGLIGILDRGIFWPRLWLQILIRTVCSDWWSKCKAAQLAALIERSPNWEALIERSCKALQIRSSKLELFNWDLSGTRSGTHKSQAITSKHTRDQKKYLQSISALPMNRAVNTVRYYRLDGSCFLGGRTKSSSLDLLVDLAEFFCLPWMFHWLVPWVCVPLNVRHLILSLKTNRLLDPHFGLYNTQCGVCDRQSARHSAHTREERSVPSNYLAFHWMLRIQLRPASIKCPSVVWNDAEQHHVLLRQIMHTLPIRQGR